MERARPLQLRPVHHQLQLATNHEQLEEEATSVDCIKKYHQIPSWTRRWTHSSGQRSEWTSVISTPSLLTCWPSDSAWGNPPLLPRCCGFRLSRAGTVQPPPAPPRLDPDCEGSLGYGEVLGSYNGNSWGALRGRLAANSALIVLAQE
eukprot:6965104-Pyramimonas_sp.AAC.1